MNILTDLQSLTMIHMVLGKLDIHIQDKEGTPPPCTCTKISRKSRDIDTRCKIEESHEAFLWHGICQIFLDVTKAKALSKI